MSEIKLTPKQKKWLEASKKIGPGAMTRTEREMLEKLYTDMAPAEQMELKNYIQENFAKDSDSEEQVVDPIEAMAQVQWSEPSDALKKTIGKTQKPRWLNVESD